MCKLVLKLRQKRTTINYAKKVHLARQVGSRYFVTAHNAAKMIFLREAALSFLEAFRKKQIRDPSIQYIA